MFVHGNPHNGYSDISIRSKQTDITVHRATLLAQTKLLLNVAGFFFHRYTMNAETFIPFFSYIPENQEGLTTVPPVWKPFVCSWLSAARNLSTLCLD